MGDIVTCICALKKSTHPGKADRLFMYVKGYREIPVSEKGAPPSPDSRAWTYEIVGDLLHITPSLLFVGDDFHTAYNWTCKFSICPPEEEIMDHYLIKNP
jgi:hypothetical protein